MKTLEINNEVYESLKAFVVDPFDDTPNTVLKRLIDIASKAQSHWSPFAARSEGREPESSVPAGTVIPGTLTNDMSVML